MKVLEVILAIIISAVFLIFLTGFVAGWKEAEAEGRYPQFENLTFESSVSFIADGLKAVKADFKERQEYEGPVLWDYLVGDAQYVKSPSNCETKLQDLKHEVLDLELENHMLKEKYYDLSTYSQQLESEATKMAMLERGYIRLTQDVESIINSYKEALDKYIDATQESIDVAISYVTLNGA